jgi:phage portal protein BeeE
MPIQSLLSRRNNSTPQRGVSFNDAPFTMINGRLVSIEDNQFNYIRSGYDINDIIYSIITLIMDKIKVAPWAVYTVKDEQALKAYHGMQKRKNWLPEDFSKAKDLRHKALEISKNPGKWGELVIYPNEFDTMPEFVANGCGYKLLLGNKFIWADLLGAGANAGTPNELYCLPSQFVQIFCSDTFPTRVNGYNVQIWNASYTKEEILHEKYWNPNWNVNGMQLYGVAPLKAALKILSRDNSSLTSSASRFDNGGISGILYMKNQVGSVDGNMVLPEVQELKKTMVTEWQGSRNTGKMGLSGYEMGWLPIGMTAEEMQQIENEKWNMRRLCNVWGVSSAMLNDDENRKYSNVQEAERALTTRCALPALTAFRDNLNRKRQEDWGGARGTIVDFDMTVYSELSSTTKETVEWLEKMPWMTPNQRLATLALETNEDPRFDEVWITQQMGQPLSEWDMTEVDQGLNQPDPNEEIE